MVLMWVVLIIPGEAWKIGAGSGRNLGACSMQGEEGPCAALSFM